MSKNIFNLKAPFNATGDQPQAIETITKKFLGQEPFATLLGVTGSGKTFTMANIIANLGKKTLILAPNKTLAAQLFEEFKDFFPENSVEYFVSYYDYYQPEAYVPGSDTYIEKDASINDEIDKLRHSATKSLLERQDVIVVASVSCIYGIGSPEEYGNQRLILFVGNEIKQKEFLKNLVEIQYRRNDMDFFRGCFRVRGDIVEVFPSYEESAVVRVEFFDDCIESISLVDPLTGQLIESLSKINIYPSSHYVVSQQRMQNALKTIKEELRERLQELKQSEKIVEYQRLKNRTQLDLEMLEEMGFCAGIENYSRHLTGMKAGEPPPTLIDFFGDDFLLIIDESHIAIPQVGGMYMGDRSRKMTLVEHGFRLPSALDNRPLNFQEFESKMKQALFVSATPGDYELQKTNGEFVEQIIRPTGLLDPKIEIKSASSQVDDILVESKKEIAKGFRILITTLTKKLAEELTNYFKQIGIKACYLHSDVDTLERVKILRSLRLGEYDVLIGINLLREGLDIPEVSLVAILDADKEGFLRSTRSLIQTIGRAARNAQGRVILYAYQNTKSIDQALAITQERRIKQEAYNRSNGIEPTTIIKSIKGGVIEVLSRKPKGRAKSSDRSNQKNMRIDAKEIDSKIKQLKLEMKQAARDLNFELAAQIRDEIKTLVELRFL